MKPHGMISIDHRQGQGIDGKQGRLVELDFRHCIHCQSCIAVLLRPCEEIHLSCIDLAQAELVAPHLSGGYVGKFRCTRCDDYLCRRCAAELELTKSCPGPWYAKFDRYYETGVYDPNHRHDYGRVSLAT